MKRKNILVLLVVLLSIASSVSYAQNQRMACADLDTILVSLPEFKTQEQGLEAYRSKLEEQLNKMREDYQKMIADYQANEVTWIPEIIEEKQKEIQQKEQNINDFQQRSQTALQKKQQELITPLIEKATNAIERVAKAKGYSHVIPTSALLYKNSSYDITADVIKTIKAQ